MLHVFSGLVLPGWDSMSCGGWWWSLRRRLRYLVWCVGHGGSVVEGGKKCVWGHCQDLFQPGIQLKIQQRQQSFWTSWMVGLWDFAYEPQCCQGCPALWWRFYTCSEQHAGLCIYIPASVLYTVFVLTHLPLLTDSTVFCCCCCWRFNYFILL